MTANVPDSYMDGDTAPFPVSSHPGLVVVRDEIGGNLPPKAYLSTETNQTLTVLLLARGYTSNHPVPGLAVQNG